MFGFYFVLSQAFCFKMTLSVLEGFDRIDSVIPPVNPKSDRKCTLVFGTVVTCAFLFGMGFDRFTDNKDLDKVPLKEYPFYPFYVIMFGFQMSYWQLVFFVERRMKLLNRMLERCVHKNGT